VVVIGPWSNGRFESAVFSRSPLRCQASWTLCISKNMRSLEKVQMPVALGHRVMDRMRAIRCHQIALYRKVRRQAECHRQRYEGIDRGKESQTADAIRMRRDQIQGESRHVPEKAPRRTPRNTSGPTRTGSRSVEFRAVLRGEALPLNASSSVNRGCRRRTQSSCWSRMCRATATPLIFRFVSGIYGWISVVLPRLIG
jgi:hypothetical protein